MTLRHVFLQCSPFGEVDLVDIEARLFFPCSGCSHVGEVDVVDLEANLFFYSALLCEVDLLDPEARICFLRCSFLVKSIFLTSRHELLFPFNVGALM